MEKPRGIVLDNPSLLVSNPEIFLLGSAFQVEPLPTTEDIKKSIKGCKCRKCGEQAIRLFDYQISGEVSGLMGRCKKCHQLFWGFFSKEQLWSNDIIVVMGSSKHASYRDQLTRRNCPLCSSPMIASFKTEEYDVLIVLPVQISCTNATCKCNINTLFWDRPKAYFNDAMMIAKEVMPHSARAGLVFVVSALESYLQKAFLFQSPNNKFLIERRKVNFQSLREARDIYKQYMGVDIKDYMSDREWQILSAAIQDRHGLIHNAGFNRKFEEIIVISSQVVALEQLVENLVTSLNTDLEEKNLF